MKRFAFIVHPLTTDDVARKFKMTQKLSPWLVEKFLEWIPAFKVSTIKGIESSYGCAEGWFVACPLTARQMMQLPEEKVIKKIVQAGQIAENLGAEVVGLGAFTSVVGDAGITIAKELSIPVTTGNSYTVFTALEGTEKAAKMMGIRLEDSHAVILGATGSIGAACAQILAQKVSYLTLVARDRKKMERLADKIFKKTGLAVKITANTKDALGGADIVLAVTSSVDTLIEPEDLKSGAVVCDVARPRNVSTQVAAKRRDVLVIEGGIVKVPGQVDFGLDFGFPPGTAYACMAETMLLALEGIRENFTLGRDLTVRQIELIGQIAHKHDFRLAGLRTFERALDPDEVKRIQACIQQKPGLTQQSLG